MGSSVSVCLGRTCLASYPVTMRVLDVRAAMWSTTTKNDDAVVQLGPPENHVTVSTSNWRAARAMKTTVGGAYRQGAAAETRIILPQDGRLVFVHDHSQMGGWGGPCRGVARNVLSLARIHGFHHNRVPCLPWARGTIDVFTVGPAVDVRVVFREDAFEPRGVSAPSFTQRAPMRALKAWLDMDVEGEAFARFMVAAVGILMPWTRIVQVEDRRPDNILVIVD